MSGSTSFGAAFRFASESAKSLSFPYQSGLNSCSHDLETFFRRSLTGVASLMRSQLQGALAANVTVDVRTVFYTKTYC